MGVLTMVLGPSGSGKSTSLMNLCADDIEIFSATGKRLPFRSSVKVRKNAGYRDIYDALRANKSHVYVIDDSTYLMQLDNFRRAQEKGFDKFVTMALSFERLLEAAMATSDDTTVYFLHHPQFGESGEAKPQTIGKMLDNQLCIEGLFDIVLECAVTDGAHVFYTNEHGIAKTPLGMFEEQAIPNDLALVDSVVRSYWGMAPLKVSVNAGSKAMAKTPKTCAGGKHAA